MSVFDNLFLLNGLSSDDKEAIISLFDETIIFKKGELIYSGDSFLRAIAVIVKGKAVAVTNNERKLVMKELPAGSCFGAAAVFGHNKSYVSHVTAQSDTEICFIKESVLTEIFKKYPQTAVNYITFLSDRIRFLNNKLSVISGSDAEDTVLKYLTSLSDSNGYAAIPVSMTMLAKMLGLGRASLYRSLDALEQSGNIIRENNRIKVIKK